MPAVFIYTLPFKPSGNYITTCCNIEFKILHTCIHTHIHTGVKMEQIFVFPGQHCVHILAKMGHFMYIVCLIIVTAIDIAVKIIKVFSYAMEM
jgi:hypothetical protein